MILQELPEASCVAARACTAASTRDGIGYRIAIRRLIEAGPTMAKISQMPASTSAFAAAFQPRELIHRAMPCQIDP